MRQILFDAYNKSPDFIFSQISHLEGIPAFPGEEHIKTKTLADLRILLQCALVDDCHKWKNENSQEEQS